MKSREATKKETRDALIRAGVSLYIAGNGDQPSLDAICAHAGFTRGAFYVHFKDRAEFLLAVIDEVLLRFVNSVIANRENGEADSIFETICRFVDAVQRDEQSAEHSELGFLVRALLRYPELNERYVRMLGGTVERLTGVIARDQQEGGMRDDLPASDISMILVTTAMGIASLSQARVGLDLSHLKDTATRLLSLEEGHTEVRRTQVAASVAAAPQAVPAEGMQAEQRFEAPSEEGVESIAESAPPSPYEPRDVTVGAWEQEAGAHWSYPGDSRG